jgi:hypothetical protein
MNKDLERYQKALEKKKAEYKQNTKDGIDIKHGIDELKLTISRLDKGMKSILPVGTKIIFKDEDDKWVETVIVENYKEKQTLILLSDYWINQELSKWYMFDYNCIYSDTLIEEFCNDYELEVVSIVEKEN